MLKVSQTVYWAPNDIWGWPFTAEINQSMVLRELQMTPPAFLTHHAQPHLSYTPNKRPQ